MTISNQQISQRSIKGLSVVEKARNCVSKHCACVYVHGSSQEYFIRLDQKLESHRIETDTAGCVNVKKQAYSYGKRGLFTCQKLESHSVETDTVGCANVKKQACSYGKRGLFI